jgi:transketolase C-terminal domain/subunit
LSSKTIDFVEDIRVNENNDYTLSPKLGSSFGSDFIKAELSASKNDKNSSSQEHKIVASMRIDRYYSSVDENKANFRKGVLDIIEDKDYVSFFKACGPMFVRSIRRAQEVTAMFTFKTSYESIVRDMEAAIKATIYGSAEAKMSSNVQNTMKTLEIKIVAFGLGLDDEGSETLVATVSYFLAPRDYCCFFFLLCKSHVIDTTF